MVPITSRVDRAAAQLEITQARVRAAAKIDNVRRLERSRQTPYELGGLAFHIVKRVTAMARSGRQGRQLCAVRWMSARNNVKAMMRSGR